MIVPWYLYVIEANIVITSPHIPGDITDTKNIVFGETSVPGLDYAPVSAGGFGNRKLSFSLQIIQRNGLAGNSNILQLYNILRNPTSTLADIFKKQSQFVQNPKVLYNYGTGSAPLVWYVTKCDFVHSGNYTNAVGNPRFSRVDMELTLDEKDPTNEMEKVYRQFASIQGASESVVLTTLGQVGLRGF